MSPDTEYSEFWNSIKENTFAKNETLGDIYTKLEEMCSEDKNKDYCLMDSDQCTDCNNVKRLYYKLYGNRIKYEWADNEFMTLYNYPIKFCNYLKYWLYDKIIFNKFDESEITKVLEGMEKSDKIKLVMGNSYMCIFDIFKLEKIKMIKLFYDYLGNYDVAKKKSSINDKICGSSYKETLNKMIDLYNDKKGEKESYEYSNEFHECKNTYNIDSVCKLQCLDDVSLSLDEEQEGCSEVYSSSQHSSQSGNPAAKLSKDPYHVREKNTSLGIITTVIPTLAVSFVIFPILYKLTSFGPWLHKSVMKTKNSLFNPHENSTDTLLNHISESGSENFMERPHYIAYHSY